MIIDYKYILKLQEDGNHYLTLTLLPALSFLEVPFQ